jgi:hypothetical protein
MWKPSKNPKVDELTKSCRDRSYRLSDFNSFKLDGKNKNCVWCLSVLPGKKQKWCSAACIASALAWAQPNGSHGLRVLLYRDGFECANCQFSYRSLFLDAFRKVRRRNDFRFPRIKSKRIEKLIKSFRRLVPTNIRPEVDHVIPVSLGGQTLGFENLQILCRQCHKVKSKKDTKDRIALKGHPRKGVKFTEKHRKALSLVRKGFDSPARLVHRQKIYENLRIKIEAINLTTGECKEFDSLTDAAAALGLQITNISKVLYNKQNRSQHKGWFFKLL